MTPCAEVWLSDAEAEAWTDQGFIPLRSIRGRDAVRIDRFQSLRLPPSSLY